MAGLYLTNTEHCTLTAEDREKAWHILAILLSIGRPVRPEELALKCEFLGASPELVRFLCTVPNSPLLLMENGLVTASAPPVLQIGRRICTLKRYGMVMSRHTSESGRDQQWTPCCGQCPKRD